MEGFSSLLLMVGMFISTLAGGLGLYKTWLEIHNLLAERKTASLNKSRFLKTKKRRH